MKNKAFKFICAILAAVMFISVAPSRASAKETGFTANDFLTCEGNNIYNANGEKIRLKGVNLGAWMVFEDWLCPYEEATDHYDVLQTLIKRFGLVKAYKLMDTYMDNFITEKDLDNIKSMGFNCVRVPFWYRNFYYNDSGKKILDANGNWDFSRLEWVVKECGKRRIYVILDLHGAPGFQNIAEHCGKANDCRLFDDTDEGERFRVQTEQLWKAIAKKFKGNPAVAMYDLLNEPSCDVTGEELTRRKNNTMIYTRLYDAVRATDPKHIITLECVWTAAALPKPETMGWTNVVYQLHFYKNLNILFDLDVILARFYLRGVPLMMGEFYPHGNATWSNFFSVMNLFGYNWLTWTYKACGHGMWEGDWCLYGSKDGFERAKVKTDSYKEIARKWGKCIRTENGYVNTGHIDTVKKYL